MNQIKYIPLGIKILLATLMFVSYFYLEAVFGEKHLFKLSDIDKSIYTLTNNVKPSETMGIFKDENHGNFYVHPGVHVPTIGLFKLHKDIELQLSFYFKGGAKKGNIEFTIIKNKDKVDKFVIDNNAKSFMESIKFWKNSPTKVINISLSKGDTLQIIVDKNGIPDYDWGKINIVKVHSNVFTLYTIIPFVWLLLFFFLANNGYTLFGVFIYILFGFVVYTTKIMFNEITLISEFYYSISLFSIVFLMILIHQIFRKFKLAFLLNFLLTYTLYAVPLSLIIYMYVFDTEMTKYIMFAIFQSNGGETLEFIHDYIDLEYIFYFVGITLFLTGLLYLQDRLKRKEKNHSLYIFLVILFLVIVWFNYKSLVLPAFIQEAYEEYVKELEVFNETKAKRSIGDIKFSASKVNNGETYIVIIGESLNKNHMGLYGYMRHTTPHLTNMYQNKGVMIFDNVYSNYTHTRESLTLALTSANQYNKKNFYASLSIPEILKKANIESYWITSQRAHGNAQNMVTMIATTVNHFVPVDVVNASRPLDGRLIPKIKKILNQNTEKNRVIFVHLLGNHNTYKRRYPEDKFTRYEGKLKKSMYGKNYDNNLINTYDNSVFYNDYVVSTILSALQKEKGVSGFVYFSDHSEDVLHKIGHNAALFTYAMTQIPMLMWFSDKYKIKYNESYKNLLEHKKSLFSNDMIYDTLVGIFNIVTDEYNSTYDLSSKDYTLLAKDALTLHGRKFYTAKDNNIYWQQENIKYFKDINLSKKVVVSKVNTIGKLHDISKDGYTSFEIDCTFINVDKPYFQVADLNKSDLNSLDEYLSSIDIEKINMILLRLGNPTENNDTALLKRLEMLNNKFSLKDKLIIEIHSSSFLFSRFSKEGWKMSYALEHSKVKSLIYDNNEAELNNYSKQIVQLIEDEKLKILSFTYNMYPFIKKYLIPKLNTSLTYIVDLEKLGLYSENISKILIDKRILFDENIKAILFKYKSEYEL